MSRLDKSPSVEPIPHGTPSARKGRMLWLIVTVVFFTLIAVTLWVWARTTAKAGYGAGRHEHSMGEATSAPSTEGDLPAIKEYPSPFRPAPSADGEESGSEIEIATIPDEAEDNTVSDRDHRNDEVVYHRRKNDRMEIALSFDDGPHPRLTPVILEILEEYGIKATFFMVGENVGYYPKAAEAVAAAGHEIGNHTFSHRKFNRMSEAEMRREIADCEDVLSGVTDTPIRFIRPPEGQMNETMRRVMGALDYRIILWDVDTRDWAHTPPADIAAHILDTVQAGDIILMHDFIGYDSPTPEALRMVIPALLQQGYHFVTVGELVDGD